MITLETLKNDFINLGITQGDTVLIRGNLGKVGRIKKEIFLKSLLDVVGQNGTIVTLGFTKAFPFYKVDKDFIFDLQTKPNTGALGSIFLNHPQAQRSCHPTNSYIAIGKNAQYILENHDENSLIYDPMKKLIELNAKMLIFGIIEDSPGFTTVHLAQQELGLTKKSFFKGFFRVLYKNKHDEIKLFKKNDVGGCSAGFGKFYSHYLSHNVLKIGKIGKSIALSINSRDSYQIEYDLLKNDNSFHLCDNPLCLSCRCTWKYNLKYLPNFIILKLINIIKGNK